ncbi:adenosine receptor A3-like [Orbicella faveolata]|uniref:adenosine receptor A3-like n=1 Tax=Orbicella faveolata TaxID=48498 RepID=UPI0009E4002D|nr:adenosine receptor A3-like [Orbicella faveolata]
MANITEDGNFASKLNQVVLASPRGTLALFSAFNIFLCITACLGNTLILVSLHKVSSIYPPTKSFFRCLAVTDLSVGLIVQPLYATLIMSPLIKMDVKEVVMISRVRDALSWIFCGVSVLMSTAISVDRLLALLLGLRYRHVVTLRRVRAATICFWFTSVFLGLIRISRSDIALKVASTLLPLSLVISIFCYTRIFFKLRHQQVQVLQGQANEGREIPVNMARYKKSVSSIFWVQLALVACYAPWSIAVVLYVNGIEKGDSWLVTETLVFFNSSLNPILYCWKIRAVRQAVKDTIRQLYC